MLQIFQENTITTSIDSLTSHLNNLMEEQKTETNDKKLSLIRAEISNVVQLINGYSKIKLFYKKYNAIEV